MQLYMLLHTGMNSLETQLKAAGKALYDFGGALGYADVIRHNGRELRANIADGPARLPLMAGGLEDSRTLTAILPDEEAQGVAVLDRLEIRGEMWRLREMRQYPNGLVRWTMDKSDL